MIGDTEILVIGAVVFLLFGADSLHKLVKTAGKMKKEISEIKDEVKR
ncbi:mttA/Hcf106 family protein [archaeon]|nr:mttA/Hcf106 family protein [archaeon]